MSTLAAPRMLSTRPQRVAVLWSHLSGYLDACLRELDARGVELLASWFRAENQAPFAAQQFAWLRDRARGMEWSGTDGIDATALAAQLDRFDPQLVLVSGWNHPGYRIAARLLKGRCVRILCMDNPWEERARQWLGRAVAPWYVRPLFEGALVAGERQWQFARRMGFSDDQILAGLYAPDAARFAAADGGPLEARRAFVFVGRLAPEKGIATLVEAYRRYRRASTAPWPLTIAGTGPLAALVGGVEGMQALGFVQPQDLPAVLGRHACLVAPSLREPWGVQISEGASAGLALVASTVCGAAVHLVREGYNGHLVAPGDAPGLARALLRIEGATDLAALGQRSRQLAAQFTPALWAANLLAHPALQNYTAHAGRAAKDARPTEVPARLERT